MALSAGARPSPGHYDPTRDPGRYLRQVSLIPVLYLPLVLSASDAVARHDPALTRETLGKCPDIRVFGRPVPRAWGEGETRIGAGEGGSRGPAGQSWS
jgi:hypothetical protein